MLTQYCQVNNKKKFYQYDFLPTKQGRKDL